MKIDCIERGKIEATDTMENNEDARFYFTVFAHLSRVPAKIFYLSCTNKDCKKKVT